MFLPTSSIAICLSSWVNLDDLVLSQLYMLDGFMSGTSLDFISYFDRIWFMFCFDVMW